MNSCLSNFSARSSLVPSDVAYNQVWCHATSLIFLNSNTFTTYAHTKPLLIRSAKAKNLEYLLIISCGKTCHTIVKYWHLIDKWEGLQIKQYNWLLECLEFHDWIIEVAILLETDITVVLFNCARTDLQCINIWDTLLHLFKKL